MKGWRTGAFFAGAALLSAFIEILPLTRGLIPPATYRWLAIGTCFAALFFRHISDGPPGWRRGGLPPQLHGGTNMKRLFTGILVVVLALFAASAITVMAEEPTEIGQPFAVTVGTGHVWFGSGDYERSISTAEAQMHLGMDWNFHERFGLTCEYVRDTAELKEWLIEHRFSSDVPTTTYKYSVLDLAARYVFNPGDRACIYALAGGSVYFQGDHRRGGFLAGVGLDYDIASRTFLRVTTKYRHVERFIVPVANVVETGVSLGIRF